jgi:hypothetical protein
VPTQRDGIIRVPQGDTGPLRFVLRDKDTGLPLDGLEFSHLAFAMTTEADAVWPAPGSTELLDWDTAQVQFVPGGPDVFGTPGHYVCAVTRTDEYGRVTSYGPYALHVLHWAAGAP